VHSAVCSHTPARVKGAAAERDVLSAVITEVRASKSELLEKGLVTLLLSRTRDRLTLATLLQEHQIPEIEALIEEAEEMRAVRSAQNATIVVLAGAIEQYPFKIEDHVCLDVGASTGGFTEVLLANGASLVFAVDVGRKQLHPSLRGHPKVFSMEETDIRNFEGKRLPARPDVVVIDAMFSAALHVAPRFARPTAVMLHTFFNRLVEMWRGNFVMQSESRKRAGFPGLRVTPRAGSASAAEGSEVVRNAGASTRGHERLQRPQGLAGWGQRLGHLHGRVDR